MCYRDLYEYVQGLEPQIQVPHIRQKIADLLPGKKVTIVKMALDHNKMRGFYISHRNEDTLYYQAPSGYAVIVLSTSLDDRWMRYVEMKELMHLFDDPLQSTSTAAEFESLAAGMIENVDPAKMSPQCLSEFECMWRAVSLFCPEVHRQELQQKREQGLMTDAQIAEQLGIPERFVAWLMSEHYKTNIAFLLKQG